MTVCIKYPDISSPYYLAMYKRTRRQMIDELEFNGISAQ